MDSTKQQTVSGGMVSFVGTGPGDPDLLTAGALRALAEAHVVVSGRIEFEPIIERFCGPEVELIDPADAGVTLASIEARLARSGRRVVRLFLGDGMLFSGLEDEARACQDAGATVDVIPGVSVSATMPWYTGLALDGSPCRTAGSRGIFQVIDSRQETRYGSAVADPAATTVVLGTADSLTRAAAELIVAGLHRQTPIVVSARTSTDRQHSHPATLGTIRRALRLVGEDQPDLVMAFGNGVAARPEPNWFESRPLHGWRVVVPTTQPSLLPDERALKELGATLTVVPTMVVEPPRTASAILRAVNGIVNGEYRWIAFTSPHAVRAIRERFAELGLDVRALAGVGLASVAGETDEALREWGIVADLISPDASSHSLLDVWPEHDAKLDPMDRVLLPRADIATETLVDGLVALGWTVDDVTAYRAMRAHPPAPPIREAIKHGRFDAVMFTSPACVRNLIGIAGKPHARTVVACIGTTTARTAADYGLRVDVIASRPTTDAMIAGLTVHARELRDLAVQAGKAPRKPSERRRMAVSGEHVG